MTAPAPGGRETSQLERETSTVDWRTVVGVALVVLVALASAVRCALRPDVAVRVKTPRQAELRHQGGPDSWRSSDRQLLQLDHRPEPRRRSSPFAAL